MPLSHFFITGCPRSGTTMLQQALNRHTDVVVPAETKYFCYFYGMPIRWQRQHVERMKSDLGIHLEAHTRVISDDEAHLRYFRGIAERCIDRSGKSGVRFFGEKTPEHANRIPLIRRVLPDSKVIYVHRDPRAVVASLLKVPWITCSPRTASLVWNKYVQFWLLHQRSPDPNTLIVRYEDLARSPRKVLRQACAFLGAEFQAEVADGTGDSQIIPERELRWKSHSLRSIDTSRIDQWKEILSDREVAQVERLTGSTMLQMGYQPETDPPYRPCLYDRALLIPESLRTASSLTYQCLLSELRFCLKTKISSAVHPNKPQQGWGQGSAGHRTRRRGSAPQG
ncbi:sulfotransferase family protein [Stieleria neptunia]|nr:sulfotransferase [Stieleria neptunia]